jgi:xylulokinase
MLMYGTTLFHDPDARGVIAGLTTRHGRGHVYRALLEATGYAARHALEAFAAAGADVTRTVAVGGGAASELWLQVLSDVTGLAQEVPAVTVGAAYGDALLAAQGSGLVPLDAVWSRPAGAVEPAGQPVYEELYAAYRALHPATVEIQHRLAAVGRAVPTPVTA